MISKCSTSISEIIKEALTRIEQSIVNARGKISQSVDIEWERDLKIFISLQEQKIKQLGLLEHFQVGEWVTRNNTKFLEAGKIIDIHLDKEDYPVIVVAYDLQASPQKENPVCLRKCSAQELNYQWHELKIVRKIDRYECSDIEIVKKFLAESQLELTRANLVKASKGQIEDYQKMVAYCKNRISSLGEKLPPIAEASEQISLDFDGFEEPKEQPKDRGISDKQRKLLTRFCEGASKEVKHKILAISKILCDPLCQQREALELEVVEEYKQVLIEGGELPSVKVKFDGTNYWLYDGFHTVEAYKDAGRTEIRVDFSQGTLRDAILASCGVNASHGLRRSNQTKRNAVMTLLQDEEWSKWSNNEIAKRCQVSHTMVNKMREKFSLTRNVSSDKTKDRENLTLNVKSDKTEDRENLMLDVHSDKPEDNTRKYINKHGTESTMKVNNIGKKNLSSPAPNIPVIEFLPGQLLKLELSSLEGVPEDTKMVNHRYCEVVSKSEAGNWYIVAVLDDPTKNYSVKAEDLKVVDEVNLDFQLTYTPAEYRELIAVLGSRQALRDLITQAIEERVSIEVKRNSHGTRKIG